MLFLARDYYICPGGNTIVATDFISLLTQLTYFLLIEQIPFL